MKGKRYLFLLLIQHFYCEVDCQDCSWKSTVEHGQQVQTVHLKHPKGITLSYENIRGTSNLTFTYSNDISMTTSYKDGQLDVNVASSKLSSDSSSSLDNKIGLTTMSFLLILACVFTNNRNGIVLIILLICIAAVFTLPLDCSKPHIHIQVPLKYTDKICINSQECFPTKCKLLLSPTMTYSDIPSNNRILFENNFCKIKKPEFWDDWVFLKIGVNNTGEEIYLMDFDNDGLVNIVEYYGDLNLFNTSTLQNRIRRDTVKVSSIGTDPKNPDSDGDLLLDGFEFFNEMSPVKPDDSNADDDFDGLSNLKEQILNTNPKNSDTDGDGVNDGEEVKIGTDPNDPSDEGKQDDSIQSVTIELTIGDHSSSHSERYVIKIGVISHQSPGFGLVGTGEYTFNAGRYPITVQHVASIRSSPDYDYTALVKVIKNVGDVTARVRDPERLLGRHMNGNFEYSAGKSALLIVEANCPIDATVKECHCHKDCSSCSNVESCNWVNSYCRKKRLFEFRNECPCQKCKNWYDEEKKNNNWLKDLNTNFKCPCRASFGSLYAVTPIENLSNKVWVTDPGCSSNSVNLCSVYHPGANGCMRSKDKSDYGAGQQCCYYKNGNIIPAGNPGAGTPDKGHYSSSIHSNLDVDPYNWCCKNCETSGYCDYYIKNLRKGDTSHCDRCPCQKCKKWYDEEKKNTNWLKDLNNNFKCPCRAKFGFLYAVSPIDNPSNKKWVTDPACSSSFLNLCSVYHPGAHGCMRSKDKSDYGAGQQCCYYKNGNIIPAGNPGAGTPDKGHYSSTGNHNKLDVDPYNWCCKNCETSVCCDQYIKNLRKGDTSHCNN